MAATFKKAVLKLGEYVSPDGKVVTTADRLKHFADTFRRMKSEGAVIPISWDHASDAAKLTPLSSAEFEKQRSAQNTVGRLVDFAVNAARDGADLTLEVTDPKAQERAERNEVYVSPVIFDHWQNSRGNKFTDCITHVDFVNHPVDDSQGPFVKAEPGTIACAIRMGLSTNIYRLSEPPMADDDSDDSDDSDVDDKADEGEGDKVADDGKLKDVMASLTDMQIILSADTSDENFLDHLHQALLTAKAMRDGDSGQQSGEANQGGDIGGTTVGDPGIATMSQQSRAALAYAERTHRREVTNRLDKLLADGRCTPAEHKTRAEQVVAVRLSLTDQGEPVASKLEEWLDCREVVPAGTFWDATKRTKMSQVTVAEPPNMTGDFSSEEAKNLANWALGGKFAKAS